MSAPDELDPTAGEQDRPAESSDERSASGKPDAEPDEEPKSERVRDTVALVVLSITAVLTAWCGFEASKWGGEMSIAFSQASTARIEAARQQGIANNARQGDLSIYAVYVQAVAENNTRLSTYVEERFTDEFKVAFDAWVAAGRPTKAPFAMPEYVPTGTKEAAAADQRADQLFAKALANNQRGDNYTILTVLAALVLFFSALSSRLPRPRARWVILGLAIVLLIIGASVAATYPVIV